MTFSDLIHKLKHEINALTGKEAKDKEFCAEHVYENIVEAKTAFENSKAKLFDVNKWTEMKGINSTFILHDANGKQTSGIVEKGYYIWIELPGIKTENWVEITDVKDEDSMAEFTVHPCEKPAEKHELEAETKHFFTEEASSTFRLWRNENTIHACEIGRNEVINNDTENAGERALLNTLIAEGGWMAFQKIQWGKLTGYLVHKEE